MTVRVMVHAKVRARDREAFERAYLKVTEGVRGTPGHLRDELIRDASDPSTYVLLAEWETERAFLDWVGDPRHQEVAAPMLPYWRDGIFERRVYDVRVRPEFYRIG